jgi:hypothetical protein
MSGQGAGSPERDAEGPNGQAVSVKYPPAEPSVLPLQILRHHALPFKKCSQFDGHRKRATVSILCRAWIQPDFSCPEVNVPPFKRKNLTVDPPTRERKHLPPVRGRSR